MTEEEQIRRDVILAAVFAGTSLLAFALSFTLMNDDGRPLLFSALVAVSMFCLWKAKSKVALIGTALFFLMSRVLWVAIATHLGAYD